MQNEIWSRNWAGALIPPEDYNALFESISLLKVFFTRRHDMAYVANSQREMVGKIIHEVLGYKTKMG